MTTPARPKVSVVTATYNRSKVLRCALESLCRSTVDDWECWVIGDACTDETEEVVRGLGESRIHFHNLERNVGEQSGPNNEGVRRARGEYLAFLNHDDLWLPAHLERSLAVLEETGADLVYGLGLAWHSEGARLVAATPRGGAYRPTVSVPASLWVMRRRLAETVGPWRSYRDTWAVPSQDWLMRAWKSGADLRLRPEVTAVLLQSGSRPASYLETGAAEHEEVLGRLAADSRFLERELTRAALPLAARSAALPVMAPVRHALANAFRRLALRLGVVPSALSHRLKYGRKGGYLDHLRRLRGLPPLRPRSTEDKP